MSVFISNVFLLKGSRGAQGPPGPQGDPGQMVSNAQNNGGISLANKPINVSEYVAKLFPLQKSSSQTECKSFRHKRYASSEPALALLIRIFRIFKGTCVREIRRWFQENVAVPSVNFFLQLCRHSHVKCNHCVPDVIKASPFYPLAKWFLCKKRIPHTYRYEY